MNDDTQPDLVEITSPLGFAAVFACVNEAIASAGLTVFATIDHAKGAAQAGLAMPPTVVLIYGHPKGGTPIMLAAPSAALDLPLRVLVREVEGGTSISFHAIAPLLQRAGVPDRLANALDGAQSLIAAAVQS
jgi:uncharacterized protein (DUF302 family)